MSPPTFGGGYGPCTGSWEKERGLDQVQDNENLTPSSSQSWRETLWMERMRGGVCCSFVWFEEWKEVMGILVSQPWNEGVTYMCGEMEKGELVVGHGWLFFP